MGFLSDLADSITGAGDRDAARRATRQQIRAEQEARAELIALQQPFIDIGTRAIPQFNQFVDDPTGADFLEGNPLFQAAVDNANRATMNVAAAGGRVNSGGVIDELFKNYLAIGDDFVNSAFRRAAVPVEIGQNAASFTGTNVSNSITREGAARAAGSIATQNARNQGASNLLNLGTRIFGLFGGGSGTPPPSTGGGWPSDMRLKENLELVGEAKGLPVYEFNYIGEEARYIGYLAQDVEKVDPDHVLEINGYLAVSEKYAPVRV